MDMWTHPEVVGPTITRYDPDEPDRETEEELVAKFGRERGGYQYRDKQLRIVHVTSIPKTDNEALDYFENVAGWTPEVRFVEGHPHTSLIYMMLPYSYVDGEVVEGMVL